MKPYCMTTGTGPFASAGVDGTATKLDVSRSGLVQAVDVPAGQGILTWSYVSPGFRAGLAMSVGGAVLLLLLLAAARWSRLKLRRSERVLTSSASLLPEPPGQRSAAGVS